MLVGRLVGYFLLKMLRPPAVLATTAVCALILILVSVTSTGYLAVWTMIAVGLFNSIMFATIFSLSVNGLGKYTTQASGILSTAIVGGAIISLSQGILKDASSWGISFLIPMACYVYIVFYGLNGYKSRYNVNDDNA
jgi:FHS family L-fucose permease-like MFS transporter